DVSRASSCPDQRSLRLGQPEGHVHGTIQVDSGSQLGAGLLLLARLGIPRAETAVAVGQERAHTELGSQGEGLPVVDCGLLDLWRIAMHGDLAKEPKGLCLGALLLMVSGLCQGAPRQLPRLPP